MTSQELLPTYLTVLYIYIEEIVMHVFSEFYFNSTYVQNIIL